MVRLVECVPNFSEGRDKAVIDAISRAISGVSGVRLLDVDPGADTNRTVYTFVGEPEAVSEAAFRAAVEGAKLIDMTKHAGAHPRMGALDVCPIVPVTGVTMDECVEVARALGRRMSEALALPVYFYEFAATRPERRNLADVRAGEYEGLPARLADPAWKPDAGPAKLNARLGATVVGAREFLIAYNVNLNTRLATLANEVALNIREAGRLKRDAQGEVVKDAAGQDLRVPGRLKAVKAIGWYIDQYRQAQVSINLLSFRTTPLHVVYETAREEAAKLGLIVTGSETDVCVLATLMAAIDHGYRVIVAASGPEALDTMRTLDRLDILVTDVVLPGGLDGRQIGRIVRQRWPGTPVLLTTGMMVAGPTSEPTLEPGESALHKPYRRAQLAASVRHALETRDHADPATAVQQTVRLYQGHGASATAMAD